MEQRQDVIDYARFWRQVTKETWAKVKVFHAQVQVSNAQVKIVQVATALIACGLAHEAEVMAALTQGEESS